MATPEILASELNAFITRRDAKFAEICRSLREQLGMGDLGETDAEQSAAITKAAEEQIEAWQAQSTLTEQANPTPLQRLLAEYCDLETQIMKREDEIAARIDDLDDDDDDDD
jgi:hypothetical protein